MGLAFQLGAGRFGPGELSPVNLVPDNWVMEQNKYRVLMSHKNKIMRV